MKAFNFLTKRAFYIHLLIAIALVIIIIEVVFFSLRSYTRHGDEIIVPDFVGLNCDSVLEVYADDFNFILLDSVYSKSLPEGSVYQQDPMPDSKVKKGRNLYYVKVSEAPEMVVMPNLRNLSLRQAIVTLRANGLKVDELEYVDHFAKNAVVDQMFDGDTIQPGEQLTKGSAVRLIVGYGRDDKKTHLPNLLTVKRENVKNCSRELEKARVKLSEVMQERKMHEKLKEKKFDEFINDLNSQVNKETDEIVSYQFNTSENEMEE